ncbi:MAG: DUF2062 domain-containing protein [Proteobacteria bacterium]|nr:DUF2062 domain-containing protein [Pseudomonadota bacterium]
MSKKVFKKLIPTPQQLFENRFLNYFRHFFTNPNLWHLNRYSVASAVSIGLFYSFMPIPGHMILAAITAFIVKANLPISVALVWINNPFTIAPMFIFAYELGAHLLSIPPEKFHMSWSYHWFVHEFKHYYDPLLLGCLICGTCCALIGNFSVRLYWRYHVSRLWKNRQQNRRVR